MKSILIATANKNNYETLCSYLEAEYQIEQAADKEICLEMYAQKRYEFVFIEVDFLNSIAAEKDYKNALKPFRKLFPNIDIFVMAPSHAIREAVDAVKAGATNYITYPLNREEVYYLIQSVHEQRRMQSELNYLRKEFWHGDSYAVFRTNSSKMRNIFDQVRAVSETKSTVLLTGDTGTGKGIIARLIHQQSQRNKNQFISVHCGAIPETLLESELFGHEKGAFTGAIRRKLGKFEIAHQGTIFLDEIGTISLPMQIKLLQILQERKFQRVGGEETLGTDVRIIAATNDNLKELCEKGLFRQDLYYRLNVFPIEIPSLKERIEDIPLLVDFFLKRLNRLYSKNIFEVHPQVLHAFQEYEWPGNIRELENLIERAYILESSGSITPESLPLELFKDKIALTTFVPDVSLTLEQVRRQQIEKIERLYLLELLRKNHGKINTSAAIAGIGVRQLHKLMKKYNIQKNDFKSSSKN
jgi:DNA-binding NtrC family response regulator